MFEIGIFSVLCDFTHPAVRAATPEHKTPGSCYVPSTPQRCRLRAAALAGSTLLAECYLRAGGHHPAHTSAPGGTSLSPVQMYSASHPPPLSAAGVRLPDTSHPSVKDARSPGGTPGEARAAAHKTAAGSAVPAACLPDSARPTRHRGK